MVEFSYTFPFGGCTYDHAEIFRLDALNQLPQTGTFFARLDFGGDRDLIGKWYQYDVSSGK